MAEVPKSIYAQFTIGERGTPRLVGAYENHADWMDNWPGAFRRYVLAESTDEIAALIRSTNEAFEFALTQGTGPRHRQGVARSPDPGTLANALSTEADNG